MIVSSELPCAALKFDPSGTRHLFVRENSACARPAGAEVGGLAVWTVAHDGAALSDPQDMCLSLRSVAALLERLERRLAQEKVGLRLYVAGSATFLAQVAKVADAAGLGVEEVMFAPPSDGTRRVMCIHCDTITETADSTSVVCQGCGTDLCIREHYSRQIGAYMGVGEPAAVVRAMEEAAQHG